MICILKKDPKLYNISLWTYREKQYGSKWKKLIHHRWTGRSEQGKRASVNSSCTEKLDYLLVGVLRAKQLCKSDARCYYQPCVIFFHIGYRLLEMWNRQWHRVFCICTGYSWWWKWFEFARALSQVKVMVKVLLGPGTMHFKYICWKLTRPLTKPYP